MKVRKVQPPTTVAYNCCTVGLRVGLFFLLQSLCTRLVSGCLVVALPQVGSLSHLAIVVLSNHPQGEQVPSVVHSGSSLDGEWPGRWGSINGEHQPSRDFYVDERLSACCSQH